MAEIVISKNNVPIRLTDERWLHIVENHDDLAGYYDEVLATVEEPDYILQGYRDAKIALREIKKQKFLAVIFKELSKKEGFVITAYFTTKIRFDKEKILWQKM
ncbi:MAG: hypothetical protein HY800_08490 [Ignavibacteriales bacterium]|nr:hypothetical protein [Ignavibacteriales bacterium]